MAQGNIYTEILFNKHSISLSKLLIDISSIQTGFNSDMVDDCRVITQAPLPSNLSNSHIMTSKALRDFVYPIGCQYRQYPIVASDVLSDAFPLESEPVYLFGGSWEKIWNTEGTFFRLYKSSETGRVNGFQNDATAVNNLTIDASSHYHSMGTHIHYICVAANYNVGGYSASYSIAYYSSAGDNTEYSFDEYTGSQADFGLCSSPTTPNTSAGTSHSHTFSSTDTETRPDNRLFRIWRRTA